jgi:hypothetical protein
MLRSNIFIFILWCGMNGNDPTKYFNINGNKFEEITKIVKIN